MIIDEYAKVSVGQGGTELLQPHVEETAWVVRKLTESVSRGGWRQRLVLASAKIDPAYVQDFFGVDVGFVNVRARK